MIVSSKKVPMKRSHAQTVEDQTKRDDLLAQIICDIKDVNEAKAIFFDLLTETERMALSKRLAVALSLSHGKSYEEIKKNFNIRSATIARVQESLNTSGMRLAVEKATVDEWAGGWAKKLAPFFEKILGK